MDAREKALFDWLEGQLPHQKFRLSIASGDASFRRYFRVHLTESSFIAMDAPPEKEDSNSFVEIARHWHRNGIAVPEIHAYDLDLGFLLLSDMGDTVLLSAFAEASSDQDRMVQAEAYYPKAIAALCTIQSLPQNPEYALPDYDSNLLQNEMRLFTDWLIAQKLGIELDDNENELFSALFSLLEYSALAQPQTTVHRDYHSRNLMLLDDGSLGVLDFQDAVTGPVSYDLVSLLRDCYVSWPQEDIERWCQLYVELATEHQLIDTDIASFMRDFDLMGMQRHLKAAGIFARLSLRDGKHGYLNDIPRTVDYLLKVSARYPETAEFHDWLNTRMLPALEHIGVNS